jgi:hypothetical protein
MFPGQTSILRFNLVIRENKSFKLVVNLTSNIDALSDFFEVQKFFISNVGANYPCVSVRSEASYKMDLKNSFGAVGAGIALDLDFYPIDILNISASTVNLILIFCI